jgi:hypothetical protein
MPRGGRRSTTFKPGVSGNPDGRPRRPDTIAARQIFVTVRTAARALTQEAIDTLAAVMRDGRAPPAARIGGDTFLLILPTRSEHRDRELPERVVLEPRRGFGA